MMKKIRRLQLRYEREGFQGALVSDLRWVPKNRILALAAAKTGRHVERKREYTASKKGGSEQEIAREGNSSGVNLARTDGDMSGARKGKSLICCLGIRKKNNSTEVQKQNTCEGQVKKRGGGTKELPD